MQYFWTTPTLERTFATEDYLLRKKENFMRNSSLPVKTYILFICTDFPIKYFLFKFYFKLFYHTGREKKFSHHDTKFIQGRLQVNVWIKKICSSQFI